MFKRAIKGLLVVAMISGGILFGLRSGDATPARAPTIHADVNTPGEASSVGALELPASSVATADDDPDTQAIPAATCDDSACDASCIARGFCEGGCRTTGKCTCLGHPPVCP